MQLCAWTQEEACAHVFAKHQNETCSTALLPGCFQMPAISETAFSRSTVCKVLPYQPMSNAAANSMCACNVVVLAAWHTSSACSSLASSRSRAGYHQPSSAAASAIGPSPPQMLPMHPCTTPATLMNNDRLDFASQQVC